MAINFRLFVIFLATETIYFAIAFWMAQRCQTIVKIHDSDLLSKPPARELNLLLWHAIIIKVSSLFLYATALPGHCITKVAEVRHPVAYLTSSFFFKSGSKDKVSFCNCCWDGFDYHSKNMLNIMHANMFHWASNYCTLPRSRSPSTSELTEYSLVSYEVSSPA